MGSLRLIFLKTFYNSVVFNSMVEYILTNTKYHDMFEKSMFEINTNTFLHGMIISSYKFNL